MRVVAIILLLTTLSLQACSIWSEKDASDATQSDEQTLYRTAQNHINNRFWDEAITSLQRLEANHPFGRYAEQSQLELIYAYYKNDEPEAASATAERFIRLHPDHEHVDYAYYMRGLALFTRSKSFMGRFVASDLSLRDPGSATESFTLFQELVSKFPRSQYVPDATKRMEFLRNLLARHEIHVANYYFERKAYLAATNRGRYVVENFQQSPAIPDALAVMAQGYHLLGMDDLANDSIAVLKQNFADYPAFTKDGRFNFQYKANQQRSIMSHVTFGFFDKQKPPTFDTRTIYNPIQ